MKKIKYQELFADLKKRLVTPWDEPSFLFYFLFIVCIISPAGVWLALINKTLPETVGMNALSNLSTYFFSLSVTSCLAFVNIQRKENKDNSIVFLACLIGAIQVATFLLAVFLNRLRLIPALIGLGISLTLWVIANSDNSDIPGYDSNIRNESNGLTKGWTPEVQPQNPKSNS